MGAMALLVTMAWLHAGDAGYPLGGSLPLARNVERRYLELGGEIRYGARVASILTQRTGAADRASGVELADGTVAPAEVVISAADGHATIYEMLGGAYLDDELRGVYERDALPALLPHPVRRRGRGSRLRRRTAERSPGLRFALDEPIGAGAVHEQQLEARIFNFDPAMAPDGKTVITAMLEADGPYWLELRERDGQEYGAEKARIGEAVVRALDRRFPGLKRAGRDGGRRHAGDHRPLHRQLARQLRRLDAHPQVPHEGAAASSARASTTSTWSASGSSPAADCRPAS